jgi:hypothetical protein
MLISNSDPMDGIRAVVFLRGEHNRLGCVLDVQKFPCG